MIALGRRAIALCVYGLKMFDILAAAAADVDVAAVVVAVFDV